MAPAPPPSEPLAAVHPLTAERFGDLERVFAGRGCSFARGCWCMHYRETGAPVVPDGMTTAASRKAGLRRLASGPLAPGLLGYDDSGEPVGWVSLGPREDFAKLARSPVMKPVDGQPVWSVICFVVPAPHRGRGIARALLAAGVDFARGHGAEAIEGYPVDSPTPPAPQHLWFGTGGMFRAAGFVEIARRKPTRPVMRLVL